MNMLPILATNSHKLGEIGTRGAQQPAPRVVHSPEEWRINVSERPAIKET